MTANPSTRWGELAVDGLVAGGVDTVVIAPGSRSTPLVVAATSHPDVETISILDERAAAFFALGRAKQDRSPVAVVCTSGTAGANMHPAVIEADRSRTPLVVCTADRPPALHAAGANQTIDQEDLFGDAVRWSPAVPGARPHEDAMQALNTIMTLAGRRSTHPVPGPVHLNVPFRKPLSPAEHTDASFPESDPSLATADGSVTPHSEAIDAVADRLARAERPLIVAGPMTADAGSAVASLAAATDLPVMADPLAGLRYRAGEHTALGGYDGFLPAGVVEDPDVVLRFGARPTSVALRTYLEEAEATDVLVDPLGSYRDPSFAVTEIVAGTPRTVSDALVSRRDRISAAQGWVDQLRFAEAAYWERIDDHLDQLPAEGRIARRTVRDMPSDGLLFVSNSMPIRDVDRFGRPTDSGIEVLANRGASGIDGITSSAIGAASAAAGSGVLLTGDLAFYHDLTGILGMKRAGVDLTIVIVNNDGGGIFHALPIADVDPPFTDHFLTPHGLSFEHVAALYDLPYHDVRPDGFAETFRAVRGSSAIVDVAVDGNRSHRDREALQEAVIDDLGERLGPV